MGMENYVLPEYTQEDLMIEEETVPAEVVAEEQATQENIRPLIEELPGYKTKLLLALEDISRKDFSDIECTLLYGVNKETLLGLLTQALRARERRLYAMEFVRANPRISVFDEKTGLYHMKTSERNALYGSLFSIVDANPALEKLRPIAAQIRSGAYYDGEIPGHLRFESEVVVSGSSAQREVHKFPADFDFAEHLDLYLERDENFAPYLAELIVDPVHRTTSIPYLDFREMKFGLYPEDYGEGFAGRAVWWSPEEISRGEKTVVFPNGSVDRLPLHRVGVNPGMIKINWMSLFDDELKELTKVVNVRIFDPNKKEVLSNRVLASAFQEIYFDDVEHFELTELTRNPVVRGEYLDFLKNDAVHYVRGEHPNYLKAAKRAYSYFKIHGEFGEARKMSPLFESPVAELAARADSLHLLSAYIKEGGKFQFPDLAGQAERLGLYFTQNRGYFSDEEYSLLMEATHVLREKLLDGVSSPETLAVLVDDLEWRCRNIVNDRSLDYLKESNEFMRMVGSA